MTPYPYQRELAQAALLTIKQYGIVYLAFEERCGKTLTSILAVEASKAQRCLIITKKKALNGWEDTLLEFEHKKDYTVTNYHNLFSQHKVQKKIKGKMETIAVQKLKPQYDGRNFDVVILDECFVGSTLVDGKPIKDIKVGNYIQTSKGKRRVYKTHKNIAPEELCEVTIGDKTIVCTPDHLFKTKNRGWIKIKEATRDDIFITH